MSHMFTPILRSAASLVAVPLSLEQVSRGQGCPRSVWDSSGSSKYPPELWRSDEPHVQLYIEVRGQPCPRGSPLGASFARTGLSALRLGHLWKFKISAGALAV